MDGVASAVAFLARYQYIAHAHVVDALTLGTLEALFSSDAASLASDCDGESSAVCCRLVMRDAEQHYAKHCANSSSLLAKCLVADVLTYSTDAHRTLPPGPLRLFCEAASPLLAVRFSESEGTSQPHRAEVESPCKLLHPRGHAVCDKKLHEVLRMAPFVHSKIQELIRREAAKGLAADVVVVDIGAGQGYLTCELAATYGYRCVAVERDGVQQHGAIRRSSLAVGSGSSGSVAVVNMMIDESTKEVDFELCVLQALPESLPKSAVIFALVSLHACGSLSANMLRMFTQSPRSRLLINVGCCYNLIDPVDFPMSSAVRSMCAKHRPSFAGRTNSADLPSGAPLTMTKNMFMAACQAPQKWLISGPDGEEEQLAQSLDANAMRCVLQLLLKSALDCDDLGRIGRVASLHRKRLRASMEDQGSVFWAYAESTVRRVLSTMEQTAVVSEEEAERSARALSGVHLASGSQTQQRLALLWSSKAVLGSVLEGLILKDRELFIKEQCPVACWLEPLFDPKVSPRFVAVVALK
jgi:hypothetical protein